MKNVRRDMPIPSFNTNEAWALFLSKTGFTVMPGVQGTKIPAGPWQPWEQNQSVGHIQLHWHAHPLDEVCLIAGHKLCVLDADRPEAIDALYALEDKHWIYPLIEVETTHGVHHYFGVGDGVVAKPDSHNSAEHPARLDVRVGRSLVMGPGSPGKSIMRWDIETIDDLTPITQAFIDDIARLNGRRPPSEMGRTVIEPSEGGADVAVMARLVRHIPPAGYDVWTKVGMAIHTESGGSAAGLSLYDKWSACGRDYVGPAAIRKKWDSFRRGVARPCSIGTLKFFAKQNGANVAELVEPFERVDMEVVG